MNYVVDIETDRLVDPSTIWVIVAREVDTNKVHVFENPLEDKEKFIEFSKGISTWIGHNFLAFDAIWINHFFGSTTCNTSTVIDTLVVSRLLDFSREEGHSLEAYGVSYGTPKVKDVSFSSFNPLLVSRCIEDTKINLKLYKEQLKYICSNKWKKSIHLEHQMVLICNQLNSNGFHFNRNKAIELLSSIDRKST